MAGSSATIWPAAKHTLVKHLILSTYLKAWVPIMSRYLQKTTVRQQSLLFIDAFAGPGRYQRGQDGSPILAIKAIIDHSVKLPVPVHFLFVEKDPQRHENLTNVVNTMADAIKDSGQIQAVEVRLGECQQIINRLVDDCERTGKPLGPAFVFLDQFGYSDVSMELIKKVMNQPLCEVFSYLNWENMNRFIEDEAKWSAISRAYGGDEWKGVINLDDKERSAFMLKTYRNALETKAASSYVWHFAMCDRNDKLIYWLFFCTNSLRGLEEMKRAMWKVDPTGGFRFSDKYSTSELDLFADFKDELLADQLSLKFRGERLSLDQVREFVLTETRAYLHKPGLRLLEKKGLLEVDAPAKRRAGTFPDGHMQIKFLASSG